MEIKRTQSFTDKNNYRSTVHRAHFCYSVENICNKKCKISNHIKNITKILQKCNRKEVVISGIVLYYFKVK